MINIIVPTHRPQYYLLECLDSLNMQTLQTTDYRVLLTLNGDKEPYYHQIQEWLGHMSFNSELIYTDQKGVSNARNIGLQMSEDAKYVAFIDDDDYVSPNYLESLLNSACQSPENSIICSDVRTVDENGIVGKDYISRAFQNAKDHPKKNSLFDRRSFLSSSCCKLIPRDLIGDTRFDTKLRIGEDALFMASISDRISNIIPASEDAIYFRRLRTGSASRLQNSFGKRIREKKNQINKYLELYISRCPKYNILFFLSRIIAVIIK